MSSLTQTRLCCLPRLLGLDSSLLDFGLPLRPSQHGFLTLSRLSSLSSSLSFSSSSSSSSSSSGRSTLSTRRPASSPRPSLSKTHSSSLGQFACGQFLLSRSSSALATKDAGADGSGKAELISKAMRAYIDRARTHGKFMEKQCAEFEVGKRHLARIMGKDPNVDFTQNDIDTAIEYLFPSGLFAPAARPFMRHPSKVFPKKKAPQFGWDGRPFHPFFYTGKPQFIQALHDGRIWLEKVSDASAANALKARRRREEGEEERNVANEEQTAREAMELFVTSSKWISKPDLQKKLIEKLFDRDYDRLINLGDRILEHTSSSYMAKNFLAQFREPVGDLIRQREIKEPLVDPITGVRYSLGSGSRKSSKAEVILREGTGVILINGDPTGVDFFGTFLERVQILTPFSFLGRVNEFDIEAEVKGPSNTFVASAGALRLAISRALTSFCTPTEVENMRLAGLLTEDPRVRERKLPGQKGARAKFKWLRR